MIRLGLRLAVTGAAMVGTAMVVALVVTVADLFLTGHGFPSMNSEIISLPAWGVHLGIGDVVLLVAVAASGGITWRAFRAHSRSPHGGEE